MIMFRIVSREDLLDELIEELKLLDISSSESFNKTFYEGTFYTLHFNFESKTYFIRESQLDDKVSSVRYLGGLFLDYLPKNNFYALNRITSFSNFTEVVTPNNILPLTLLNLGFTQNEVNLLSKEVIKDNYFNVLATSHDSNYYPAIENLSEVYEKIVSGESLYEAFINYRKKIHELRKLSLNFNPEGYINFYNKKIEEKTPMNTVSFIDTLVESMDNNQDYVKFKVTSKKAFLSIARFLSIKEYDYSLQNENKESSQYNLAVNHVRLKDLHRNDYFDMQNEQFYKNKIFHVDFYKKTLSFWEETIFISDKTEEESKYSFIVEY